MNVFKKIKSFFDRYFFYDKWTCNVCRREIFTDKFFCEDCEKNLPFNDKAYCNHCGRRTKQAEQYCLSCKNRQVFIDKARSCFSYESPISNLILKYKYHGKKYLANLFSHYLCLTAIENDFKPDYVVFVPMTKRAKRKRKFNHGELLARTVAERLGVQVLDIIVKIRDTKRQAKSSAKERMDNLKGVFRLTERKVLENKNVLIVDDVLTTGATSETIAKLLKGAKAKRVELLTVASVSTKNI